MIKPKNQYFKPFPKPEPRKKKEDGRSFQEKYGTPIKKKPYKLKQGTPIKKATKKHLEKADSYEASKRDKYEEGLRVCESCGRNDGGISCSHLVPRSQSFALVDNPLNHCAQCFHCHQLTEAMHYYQLKNGLKLMELLWDSLGGAGRQKFWKVFYAHDGMNQSMWMASRFYNPEIHS